MAYTHNVVGAALEFGSAMSGARAVVGRNLFGMRHGVKGVLTPGGFQNIGGSMCRTFCLLYAVEDIRVLFYVWVSDILRA